MENILERVEGYRINKGKKFLTEAKTWSTNMAKAMSFELESEARDFLRSNKRIKAGIMMTISQSVISKRSNGSTIVEFNTVDKKIKL